MFTSVGLLYAVKSYKVYSCVTTVRRELYKPLEPKVIEKEKKNRLSIKLSSDIRRQQIQIQILNGERNKRAKETKLEKQVIDNSTMKGQLAPALSFYTLEDSHPLLLKVKDLSPLSCHTTFPIGRRWHSL